MTTLQLSQFAISLCGNYWIDLNKYPEHIETIMNHKDFAFVTQKYKHSLSIYFHCDGSPTGVSIMASVDVDKAKELYSEKFDALDKALLWL